MRFVALLLVCEAAACGQSRTAPMPDAGGPNLPAQRLGPNDLLAISVYGAPELTRSVRIGADGFIALPLLKARVRTAGLLPGEVESAVSEALKREEILVDPVVSVTVSEYSSRPVSVAGMVRKPLTFQAAGGVTLLDAIARAEGLTPEAGSEILVTRTRAEPQGRVVALTQRIPVKGLIDAADPELNVRLEGGEEIRVPESGRVFVVGNVKKPGSYRVADGAETTVLQVLALAEGLAPYAGKQAFVYRKEASGSKNEIPIELRKIMDRKSADVPLLANDILYVPDNKGRRLSGAAIDRVLGFAAGTLSGVLVYSSIR